ncbi:MAG: hypothetical protein WAT52_03930 [Chitinophagales bacterium]
MKLINNIVLGFLLVCTTACTSSENLSDDMMLFEKLNELVLSKIKSLEPKNPIQSFVMKVPESKNMVNELRAKYELSEIQVHKLNRNQIGVAYKLGNENDKPYRFLLFSSSIESKNEFESYEQFVECALKENIKRKWSVVTISDCTD